MNILLITTQFSPFHLEFSNSFINEDIFKIVFLNECNKRQSHWDDFYEYKNYYRNGFDFNQSTLPSFINKLVDEFAFDFVLFGGIRGKNLSQSLKIIKLRKIKYLYWLEKPFKNKFSFIELFKKIEYKYKFSKCDGILAIGPTALDTYSKLCPNKPSINFPYSQDLSYFHTSSKERDEKLTILYSGSLDDRFNISLFELMCINLAKDDLLKKVKFIISGSGNNLAKVVDCFSNLGEHVDVKYYNTFENWKSRSIPYKMSDIFIYPSLHAGWGLVIPEALASSNVVISSDKVDSALTLIKDGINGYIYKNDIDFYPILKSTIINYNSLEILKNAVVSSNFVDVNFSCKRLKTFLSEL